MSEYCSHSRQSRHFMTLFWCAIKEIWYIGAIIEWQITINYWTKLSPNHFTFLTESACHNQLGDIWHHKYFYILYIFNIIISAYFDKYADITKLISAYLSMLLQERITDVSRPHLHVHVQLQFFGVEVFNIE